MGMITGYVSSNRKIIQVKNLDGSIAGSISISKPAQKKPKRLNYNFKSISTQIMLSKTSVAAGKAITKARGTIASLLRKMNSGDYDDKEIELAVIHAKKMERIARKRVKHLKQEEEIERKGSTSEMEQELPKEYEEAQDLKELEFSKEELQELMREYQELVEESCS